RTRSRALPARPEGDDANAAQRPRWEAAYSPCPHERERFQAPPQHRKPPRTAQPKPPAPAGQKPWWTPKVVPPPSLGLTTHPATVRDPPFGFRFAPTPTIPAQCIRPVVSQSSG